MAATPVTNRWLSSLCDLLFPPHCVACGRAGAWLCADCLAAMPRLEPPFCAHCGRPLAAGGTCLCVGQPSYLDGMRSVAPHTQALRRAVHALKYEGLRVLAEPLGAHMATYWQAQGIAVDLVLPVALSRARERERGYNQSALLARALASRLDLPCERHLLVRQRHTRSQVGLSPQERWDNVWGAFSCPSAALRDQRVLLVDDVLTTGATLQACAAALRQAGAPAVWALTLTRAVGVPDAPEPIDRVRPGTIIGSG